MFTQNVEAATVNNTTNQNSSEQVVGRANSVRNSNDFDQPESTLSSTTTAVTENIVNAEDDDKAVNDSQFNSQLAQESNLADEHVNQENLNIADWNYQTDNGILKLNNYNRTGTYNTPVKGGFELSFYGGLKMYDLGGLGIDRCQTV